MARKLLPSVGTAFTAKAFGNPRSPSVKGQGMPAYEPRAVKGIGVTYANTTMSADHTAGYTIAPEIAGVGDKSDPLASEPGKADLSRAFQMTTAFLDIASFFEGLVEEVNAVLGTNLTTAYRSSQSTRNSHRTTSSTI